MRLAPSAGRVDFIDLLIGISAEVRHTLTRMIAALSGCRIWVHLRCHSVAYATPIRSVWPASPPPPWRFGPDTYQTCRHTSRCPAHCVDVRLACHLRHAHGPDRGHRPLKPDKTTRLLNLLTSDTALTETDLEV